MAERGWRALRDKVAPERWRASRGSGRDAADERFTEGPRMIANRAVPVEAMPAERGVRENPRAMIADLAAIAGAEGPAAALEALRRARLPAAGSGDAGAGAP